MKAKINTLTKLKKLPKPVKPDLRKLHKKHIAAIIPVAIAVAVLAVAGSAAAYYQKRAFPGVKVANVDVGGKTRDEVKKIVEAQQTAMKVRFKEDGHETLVPASELGVKVKTDKTVNDVMNAGRNGGFWRAVQPWQHEEVPLMTTTDVGVFKDYVVKHFPSIVKDAKDAQITYNDKAQQFEVQPGEPGQGFDVKKFEQLLPTLTSNPQTVTLAVSGTPVEPLIKDAVLNPLKDTMNERISVPIKFSYKGRIMYNVSPGEIAKWATFTPDPQSGKVSVSYDQAKINQFLNKKVGPAIAAPAVDKKVIKDPNNGSEVVLQQGQVGRQLQDVDGLTNEVISAVTNSQPLQKEVSITEAPFKTITLTGYDRWVEVDLSEQRTTLYTGATPVRSFVISSGLARSPTVTGEFRIWSKNASQTMTGGSRAAGDYYYLPNVTWVSYFHQDYSFHTAYWHNNFGTPMSHGCVNMRAADAKALYDFAPIGTKVIVHK